jgi:thiol-disulfide isomerase/thioredoxin
MWLNLLLMSALWTTPLAAMAGELTEVSDGQRFQFSLTDLDGQQRDLDEFAGKVILVNFWASWCLPCIEEMPSVKRLAQAMRDRPFAVIGVNVGEGKRRVQATAKRLGIDFPVLLDRDSSVFEAWGANVLPTAYVLDPSGRVRHIARGPMQWDRPDLVEILVQLTEEAPDGE